MSRIKDDLISEIIRVSQTNLLIKKKAGCKEGSGEDIVVDWVQSNAAGYRKNFKECLGSFSTVELGEMLSELTKSKKDLTEVLKDYSQHKLKPKTFE